MVLSGGVARRVRVDVTLGCEHASHAGRAVRIALWRKKVPTRGLLEMSRLREDHQLVERVYTKSREEFQTGPQSDPRKQVHQFLER